MTNDTDFNLVRDPWIPVTTLKGETEEWGLREFFHRAHEAQGMNEPSPLAYTTMLRLFLAIAHRATMGPATSKEWLTLWRARESGFDGSVFDAYLDRWEHRFNLFDATAPFAQVTDFADTDLGSPVSRLILEQTSGSNSTLFDHSRDDAATPITPASAARALLPAHQYAFAGTAGRYMQAPMVAGYAVSWEGNSLYETIVLNMVFYNEQQPTHLTVTDDAPFWERDETTVPNKVTRQALGLTDLYTFLGRRLQLRRDPDGMVSRVRYEQGYVLDLLGEELRDPFKRYLAQKQANAQLPRNFSENRALWRDADGLLQVVETVGIENQPPGVIAGMRERIFNAPDELKDLTPNIVAAGLVNNQARISLWRTDRMNLPLSILGDEDRRQILSQALDHTESAWSDALRPAAGIFANVGLAGPGAKADSNDVAAIIRQIAVEQRYWSQLDRKFQEFVHELGSSDDPEDALSAWKISLRNLVQTVYSDATNTLTGKRWYQAQTRGAMHLYSQLRKIGLIVEMEVVV